MTRERARRHLWPWCDWMTIGIGVVCTVRYPGDHFILASDQLGSFGDGFSTRTHGKLFCDPENMMFAVCADNCSHAAELLPCIGKHWKAMPNRGVGHIENGLQMAVFEYKSNRFARDVIPNYPFDPSSDWQEQANKLGIRKELFKQWNNLSIGCQLLVGTFDMSGMAQLYFVDSDCRILPFTSSGFWAIGSGSDNALFWLAYRQQHLGMNLLRSAYHVYESKIMAEQSPHVGRDDINLLICSREKWWLLENRTPSFPDCPISLAKLKEAQEKFGPQGTDSLGKA